MGNKIKKYGLDIAIILFAMIGSVWEIWENGLGLLGFYTTESNLFLAIACLLDLLYLKGGEEQRKKLGWIKDLKFLATCCMAHTLFVVVFVLAPEGGLDGLVRIMTEGALLFQHGLCPILAIWSFYKRDCRQHKLGIRMKYMGAVPALCYAVVTTTLNVKKIMYGPYPFLHVHEQPIGASMAWFVVIVALAAVISWVLWKGNEIAWKLES